MKRALIAILLALALVVIPFGSAFAANSAGVTVTATPGWVSITNAPDFFDFGVVLAGINEQTAGGDFTINNASTVDMDVTIECDGWTGAVPANSWAYGAPGENSGQLNSSIDGGDVGGTWLLIPESPASAATLVSDVAPTDPDPTWDLQLEAPTSFTYVDVQTTIITLTAAVTPP